MTGPERVVWRYLSPISHATHALQAGPDWRSDTAVCGVNVNPLDEYRQWAGVGNPMELRRAASLPRCTRCLRIIGTPEAV